MTDLKNWADDVAMPLHLAIDQAGDDDAAKTIEEKWAVVMEVCPWLRDLVRGPVDETILDAVAVEPEGGWTPVTSTNLDAVKMDRTAFGVDRLFVRFKSGGVWCYSNVPADLATQIAESPSPGAFFAKNVKGHYSGALVEEGAK